MFSKSLKPSGTESNNICGRLINIVFSFLSSSFASEVNLLAWSFFRLTSSLSFSASDSLPDVFRTPISFANRFCSALVSSAVFILARLSLSIFRICSACGCIPRRIRVASNFKGFSLIMRISCIFLSPT